MSVLIQNVPTSTAGIYDWESYYKSRAANLLGTSRLNGWYDGLEEGEAAFWNAVLTNGGGTSMLDDSDATAGSLKASGGVLRLQSNTAAGAASARWIGKVSAKLPTVGGVIDNAAIRFYRGARIAIESSITADSDMHVGTPSWGMGVYGPASTTNWAVKIGSGANYLVSSVAVVANTYVIIESWHDGVNAHIAVDGVENATADLAFFPLNAVGNNYLDMTAGHLANAAQNSMLVDHVYYGMAVA